MVDEEFIQKTYDTTAEKTHLIDSVLIFLIDEQVFYKQGGYHRKTMVFLDLVIGRQIIPMVIQIIQETSDEFFDVMMFDVIVFFHETLLGILDEINHFLI